MERKPEEKKGLFTKLKENIDDHDEQMQILGAMVRLGVVIWSGFIITLNYVELPMVKKSGASADITFVASVFTGALATFGLTTGNGKKRYKRKTKDMKKLILLLALLSPAVARANTVTPQFTTGSMNSTTTTTQTITEVEQRQVFGAAVNTWNGSNITASASAGIAGGDAVFTVTDTTLPWSLETTTRAAGLVEQWDTTRNYTINSTTTSLSVFSQ